MLNHIFCSIIDKKCYESVINLAVHKHNLAGQILFKSPGAPKKRRQCRFLTKQLLQHSLQDIIGHNLFSK